MFPLVCHARREPATGVCDLPTMQIRPTLNHRAPGQSEITSAQEADPARARKSARADAMRRKRDMVFPPELFVSSVVMLRQRDRAQSRVPMTGSGGASSNHRRLE